MDLGVASSLERKEKEQILLRREPEYILQLQPSPWALLQEEDGKDDADTLELYQQSLGELLLLLAGGLGPWWVRRGRDRSCTRC